MREIAKVFMRCLAVVTALCLLGCYPGIRKEVMAPPQALSQVRFFYPNFLDDMDQDSLIRAVEESLGYLGKVNPDRVFEYGPHQYTCREVRQSMETFLNLVKESSDGKALSKRIRKEFRVYKAVGRAGQGRVLFTGYFEPIYEGSLTRDDMFRYPLYGRPDDLIRIDLSLFSDEFKGKSVMARIDGKKVIPYFSRKQIETDMALSGKGLEIAWLRDPVDVDLLQIQGSGRLELRDGGTIRVGYDAKNGRPYRSIGRYMVDKGLLRMDEVSMQRIRSCLAEHPELNDEILNYDPSYVFFRILGENPLVGSINVPITPGRTLALDSRLFPGGALAFIRTRKPVVDGKGRVTGWQKFSRFVLNQDTGGAIRGAGRADLFWGSGSYAELAAGHMKEEGELYILIKRP